MHLSHVNVTLTFVSIVQEEIMHNAILFMRINCTQMVCDYRQNINSHDCVKFAGMIMAVGEHKFN